MVFIPEKKRAMRTIFGFVIHVLMRCCLELCDTSSGITGLLQKTGMVFFRFVCLFQHAVKAFAGHRQVSTDPLEGLAFLLFSGDDFQFFGVAKQQCWMVCCMRLEKDESNSVPPLRISKSAAGAQHE